MQITRRELIVTGALGGAAALAPDVLADAANKPFRVVHMTDMHVQPERRGGEGYMAAIESLAKISPAADLLITGGDHVMDAFEQELPRCKEQWELFHRAMSATKVPWKAVLGNHDIWGWGDLKLDAKAAGYGKAMGLEQLKLAKGHYSFDAGGWHFVMLDSMTRREDGYVGLLDPGQLEWLRGDLAAASAADTPIIIFSHIPILSASVFFDGERLGERDWHVPDAWMHRDMLELTALLRQHKVKLSVSGHIHLVDRVDYNGVSYICDGAVSGNWWKGTYRETPEGYGVLDLYPDGKFEHQYVTFGWKAQSE